MRRFTIPGTVVLCLVLVGCPVIPPPDAVLETATTTTTVVPPPGRPNIVSFMTDDQTWDQMLALPSVQQLIANRGVTFDNAIVPVPLCCPARASLLTGQYPHNHGVQSNKSASGGGFDGLDQTNTLARWLHDAGYRTAHVGKYMNGYNRSKAIPAGWDEWWATSQRPFLMYDYTLNHNGTEQGFGFAPADYKTDVLTRLATEFVQTSAPPAQPFYLQLWYTAPHVEEGTDSTGQNYNDQAPRPAPRHKGLYDNTAFPTAPNFNEANVSDKPAWVRALPNLSASRTASMARKYRTQLNSLAAVDEGIQQVVGALAAAGELDNTILLFTSDNGNMHGEHRIPFGKGDVYEPSIRVPLMVAGPGFPAGGHVAAPVMFPDVASTIVDRAGAQPGLQMDGRRLEDTFGNPNGDRAILIGSGLDTATNSKFIGVRTRRWVYAKYQATGEVELYDLVSDPHEMNSRHGQPAYAGFQDQLAQLVATLKTCSGAACSVPVPAGLA